LNQGKSFFLVSFGIAILLALTALWLIPVYLMVKISVSHPQDILVQHPDFFSTHFTSRHWAEVFASGNIWPPLRKSLTVAALTAILSLLFAVPGAYGISRFGGRVAQILLVGIFFTRMFPEVGIALPISVTFIKRGLFDTDLGLILAHLVRVLPISAWILVGTFKTIPQDLEEAAFVDGANKIKSLIYVVLPLAKPGIGVALIFSFLGSWDEFIYATYLSLINKTLPLMVYYYVSRGGWFLSSTYAAVITIPVVIVTYSLQRYIRSGYLSGAVKG
jgi:trehalose transport system permease protein